MCAARYAAYAVATGKAARDATEELPASLRSRQTGHRAAALDAGKLRSDYAEP